MTVYCRVYYCKHNNNGVCANIQPAGHESITIEDAIMGPMCGDIEEEDESHD